MIENLLQGYGLGSFKLEEGTTSIADGDTITAHMDNIIAVLLTAEAASGDYAIANVISISGNVITVGLSGAASGTAPSTLSTATTVHYAIIGS
ncbi:MAG: hypothetical protein OWT28_06430 [Firmicutes bacterium]|nr:hypothetical protein [Bacillota bacterium]